MDKVLIARIPSGEAPIYVRRAWQGSIIPLVGMTTPNTQVEEILSGAKRNVVSSAVVRFSEAIKSLSNRGEHIAYKWWLNWKRTTHPKLPDEEVMLIFDNSACDFITD